MVHFGEVEMSTVEKNEQVTCLTSDADFNVYFDHDEEKNDVTITGIYLVGHNQDLIDVASDEIKEDLEQDIEDKFDA